MLDDDAEYEKLIRARIVERFNRKKRNGFRYRRHYERIRAQRARGH
jgi:hypothetical protein